MGDICVNVFTFGANATDLLKTTFIYWMDARTTVGPIIDDDGKSAHSLHLFANDHSHIESHHSNLGHGDPQFTAFVDLPPYRLDLKQNCIPSSRCIRKALHSLHQLSVT
ncbi:hypothetical protein BDR07DRAFT_1418526 [Suillus spraguei]|nr:hypothetical protein BDR07DRAFT_1418526 [Suillus spraguei]